MSSSENWVQKYRPTTWGALQGNNKAIKELREWIEEFDTGDDPRLLVGPPGTGKTSFTQLASQKYDIPLVQINASDSRKSEDMQDIADTILSTPPDADKYLILLDEIDSQSGRTNKEPLYNALDKARNPVIFTANDEYEVPEGIRNRVKKHEFTLGVRSRKAKIKDIAEAEGLELSDRDLEDLAERPGLRSAIQDLQMWAEQDIPPGEDQRDWELGEFEVIDRVLHGEKESGQMNPPDFVMWLDENLSREFRGVEAATAYDTLARADKWLHRAQKEDYRYWKFAGELAEQTATQRITEPYDGYMQKDFPEWFRHSRRSPDEDSPEANLYRALKDYGEATYRFSGDFQYFRKVLLPILKELSVEERMELVNRYSLEDKGRKALDITKKQYESWVHQDVPDERQQDSDSLLGEDALSW